MSLKRLKKTVLKKTPVPDSTFNKSNFLSTGSTLINLAFSNHHNGGFSKGSYHLIVGDSASGKTFLTYTCLAEASINSAFDEYRFIVNDVEGGALFNVEKLFGSKLAERLEITNSENLEEMYYHVDDCVKGEKPFIYIVDSMDSLDTVDDEEKFQDQKKARRKGNTTSGTFGTSKAKTNSTNLRRLMAPLKKTGSILILISQTRDNLGFGFEKKTRAGGKSLRFYATTEIWSSIKEKVKKTVKGKPRTVGIKSKIDVKKNRITGRERSVIIPISYDYGIDDTTCCVEYLVDEGYWKKTGGKIKAVEFEVEGTIEKIVKAIEENNNERRLRKLVEKVWMEIEQACSTKRKSKYS